MTARPLTDCHLYGILDLGYVTPGEALGMAKKMVAGGVDVLQLRAKGHALEDIESLAERLLPITRAAGVPFVVNDYPEIAGRVGADGAHIGQDGGRLSEARALAKGLVGRSTHALSQAKAAQAEGADYIGFGPLFATPTKPGRPPIGLDEIAQVHREVSLPIFCIGGVKKESLRMVISHGARRVVIVSGILQAPDVEGYIRECREILAGA